jgi:uncharacterized protein HemX
MSLETREGLQYEGPGSEIPDDVPPRRRSHKMANPKNNQVEAPAKSYNKTRGEHFKDLIIVALIVGIAAFVGGMQFENSKNAEVKAAVSQMQSAAAPQTAVKK